jgi:hypothetical protein
MRYGTRGWESKLNITRRKDFIIQNCEEAVKKRKDFYNAELLCEELEEYDILV